MAGRQIAGVGIALLYRHGRSSSRRMDVAACDADLARAEATGATPYQAPEALLEAGGFNAVDICTPPHLHAPIAVAALERGIPVLCEKPLARNPAEAREIVDVWLSTPTREPRYLRRLLKIRGLEDRF